ncbi:mitochondrial 37S ribosomal protein mS41 [Apiospora aurea]|uniref:Small ribosomal subunit protein mS41 n=1 Tax=Apiospora aurea TaxID=335848 RepID=A0ABR1QU50_9PEZI
MGAFKPILRPQQLRPLLNTATPTPSTFFPRPAAAATISSQFGSRPSSTSSTQKSDNGAAPPPEIPAPTPFCPDVQTFLTLIGRGLGGHASKFPTWEALFSLTSEQLRELGIEPPRTRRYLLQWRQRFRRGQFGIGGDLKHVSEGAADLRVLEHDADPTNPKRYVVNVPAGQSVKDTPLEDLSRVVGYKVEGARTIVGPYAMQLKGGEGARVVVKEGMWEDKRGRKIDGGERRRTEVKYKKRIQERKEQRERGEIP